MKLSIQKLAYIIPACGSSNLECHSSRTKKYSRFRRLAFSGRWHLLTLSAFPSIQTTPESEKFRDVSLYSENMPTSFSKNPDGNQSCGCSQFETLHSQILDIQPMTNQTLKRHTYGTDKGSCIGTQRGLLYGLISIVQHHGSSGSGHYTVYRKVRVTKELTKELSLCTTMSKTGYSQIAAFMDQDEKINSEEACTRMGDRTPPKNNSEIIWFRISDSDVERVAEKCVLEEEASLLFYEKLEDVE